MFLVERSRSENSWMFCIPEFEQINPLRYVPVLIDDGIVVSDSLAILMYLEDKYPENQLLPIDPCKRALALQACNIGCQHRQLQHTATSHELSESIKKKISEEDSSTWAQTVINKGFLALEMLLKDFAGRYCIGDDVSMADVFLAPQISIAMSRFNIDMSKYPTICKVYESCKALPEFQASVPERQPDAKKSVIA
ncbi:glutathione S-transferase zeta class-like isoform X3 [Amaranthus tricolor]|uniref:glutathione S-transferase zeta class-like isoform X3 n=1 Tax=Amaranthus tricolor TaxID=29722 RepID=UPI00258EB714|nr:glutathione S-transferase zeta class-like isoform X3 [Amaranthus tricolor]